MQIYQEALHRTETKKKAEASAEKSPTMCFHIFTEDLFSRSLRSAGKIRCLAQGHFCRTDACQHKQLSSDHPAEKGQPLLPLSHHAAAVFPIQSVHHKFFMSMSKHCCEKALLYLIPCISLKISPAGIFRASKHILFLIFERNKYCIDFFNFALTYREPCGILFKLFRVS